MQIPRHVAPAHENPIDGLLGHLRKSRWLNEVGFPTNRVRFVSNVRPQIAHHRFPVAAGGAINRKAAHNELAMLKPFVTDVMRCSSIRNRSATCGKRISVCRKRPIVWRELNGGAICCERLSSRS
ncbi:hypothetical protein [Trinickia symbiotica]|uniref:hypothetical protein n=1 Tax=Trinickia symbiotica TaxID=863227 RepID=UPI0011AF825D|nr:hypothetical protein [Trinickia symbiotica]